MVDCKIGMKYCIQISCHADGKIDILWASQRGTTQSIFIVLSVSFLCLGNDVLLRQGY